MNKFLKTITAAALGASLLLSGCGTTQPLPTEPDEPIGTVETLPTEENQPLDSVTADAPTSPHLLQLNNLVAAPEYPQMPQCPRQEDYPEGSQQFYDDQYSWYQEKVLYQVASPDNTHDLDPFFQKAMEQFLTGDDNTVCSPLNVYFALAMLAQTADGNSRKQILDLLGHDSIEGLREQARQLWRAHYCSNGETVSLLANSVWLDEQYRFNPNTVQTLASEYFASVFSGDLGTDEMDKQLAAWLDSQTGGLLSEHTQQIKMPAETVFALASTAYFSADWEDGFSEANTYPEVFHCEQLELTTDFMHRTTRSQSYYFGDGFTAVHLALSDGHRMWLILPDEGSTPEDLLARGDYYRMISHPGSWKVRSPSP